MRLNMTSQSLICKYLFGCGILIIIIFLVDRQPYSNSLNKYLKHIKSLKVLPLSKYYRFSIIIMILCITYSQGA